VTLHPVLYHNGHLNCVVGIVLATHVSNRFCYSLQYFTCYKRATRRDIIHSVHTFTCVQLAYQLVESGQLTLMLLVVACVWLLCRRAANTGSFLVSPQCLH